MFESIFDNATNVEPIEKIEDIEVLDTNIPIVSETKVTPVIEVKDLEKIEKAKDKIFTIQVILILAWVILTTLVYFFGYPLFEPFINV